MNRITKATAAAALSFAAVATFNYAHADAANKATETLTVKQMANRYGCTFPYPLDQYNATIDGNLDRPHAFKAALFATYGDGTGVVTKHTNKATAATITARGRYRGSCVRVVPKNVRVAWS